MTIELKYFEMPEQMKASIVCAICGKGDCEVLAQENVPGGRMAAFHESCLNDLFLGRFIEDEEDGDDNPV